MSKLIWQYENLAGRRNIIEAAKRKISMKIMAYQPAASWHLRKREKRNETVAAYVAKRHGEAGKRHRKQ
jgi:hypothetical protein